MSHRENRWQDHLHAFRTRELERAFAGCPDKAFDEMLELGAGSGFQSALLIRYANHLIATELNSDRFKPEPLPGIEYKICDAEQVGDIFEPAAFDLIFASNLMEHLPHPERALEGMRKVLSADGIVILVMPNVLWKVFSLVGFYPNVLRLAWRALVQGRLKKLWKRYLGSGDSPPDKIKGNNLKSAGETSMRAGIFWPLPHGAYASHRAELAAYGRRAWIGRLTAAEFDVVAVRKGPLSSGYGFGFDTLRHLLEKAGFTTEYIYVLALRGHSSPYARYWATLPSGKT